MAKFQGAGNRVSRPAAALRVHLVHFLRASHAVACRERERS